MNVADHIPDVGGDGFMVIPRPLNQHSNQFVTRVDHMLTDNDRLSGRYFIDHFQNAGTYDPSNLLSYSNPTLASRVRNQNAMVGWQKTFGPTVLNDFQFSYAKNHASRGPYFDGVPSMEELGVRLPIYPTLPSISQIEASGFFSIGDNLEAKFPRDSFTVGQSHQRHQGQTTRCSSAATGPTSASASKTNTAAAATSSSAARSPASR